MSIIAHNIIAMNAQRQFKINDNRAKKSSEKLSSGYRINRAADDAAGLSISEKMRSQIRGLHRASENVEDGIGYVQVADGALGQMQEILHRIRELSIQSSNDTNTEEEREALDHEVQELKEEITHIVETTEFNTKRIWEQDSDMIVEVGKEQVQLVKVASTGYTSVNLTEESKGVVPANSYKINATQADGIYLTWQGYDGQQYRTENISWDYLESNNYKFNVKDFLGTNDGTNKLYDSVGNPIMKQEIRLSVDSRATRDDIIGTINGVDMSVYSHTPANFQFEDASGKVVTPSNVSISTGSINMWPTYRSTANYDVVDDAYLEALGGGPNLTSIPASNTSDVATAKASNDKWTFSFDMPGVGTVRATSTTLRYRSTATDTSDPSDENYWWSWSTRSNGTKYKSALSYSGQGTLGGVMQALTGVKGSGKVGLLSEANGGATDNGGSISISFDLTADTPYATNQGTHPL